MQCAKCHGEDGRGVGPSSHRWSMPRAGTSTRSNFTQPAAYRTGWTEREIIRTLETGMNGVPMPWYSGAMSKQEEYDMVAYLMSIAGPGSEQSEAAARQRAWRAWVRPSGHHSCASTPGSTSRRRFT